jgi:hypothetical protein
MDHIASFVKINKPHQDISRDLLDQPQRHPLLLEFVMLDNVEQVGTHQLENCTHVLPMNTKMSEVVKQEQRSTELRRKHVGVFLLVFIEKFDPLRIRLMFSYFCQHFEFING